jgi:N-methylhydantoinase A
VTDANVVLGYLPTELAGGEITLDAQAAQAAVKTIADAMELGSVEAAAAGIVDIVNENMFGALRLVSVQQGFDPRDFALVAFGGAGPLHANALGRLTGAWPVIIPPSPGVLCAYGDATTMVRDEAARTWIRTFGAISDDELLGLLHELAEAAAATVEAQGVPRSEQATTYHVDLRYHGQGFEITVPAEVAAFDGHGGPRAGLAALAAAFDAEHSRLFSFLLQGNEHELVSARATVTGPRPGVGTVQLPDGGTDPSAALARTTRIWVEGDHADAAVYDRTALRAQNVVTGPAIITEMDSTTLVLPGHAATVHPGGSLLIRPTEG